MKRVLIVEDNATFRETLALVLRHAGFEPLEAENAQQAMERLRADPLPAAVLTDYGLSGADGCALADWIAQEPRTAGMPVFVMTGVDPCAVKPRFPVLATLRKPFENAQIIALLRRYT